MGYPLLPDLNADQLERQLLETWRADDLFRRTVEAGREGEPFVFYEGPPTANGRPGIHHVFSRTIKDLVCRFRAMQGRSVTRIAGWDTHGLPVEIEVEKQLELKGKKAIEEYGVERFNALCRRSVFTYKADWEALSDRIGYWLDFDHPYITCSNEYIESVWWLLRRLHDRRLLYRGHRVLPYCPRCGTVLSSHELAQGYEEIHDRAIFVTFPLEDGSGRELVVWTTTPWTLPSNVAAAVHPEFEYGEYPDPRAPGRTLVLATSLAPRLLARLFGEDAVPAPSRVVPGSALVGLRYRRPLDVVPMPDDGVHGVVVAGDFVTHTDGSGIVHMAPAFGADDYAAGQAHGLALVRPVAADGTFVGTTWPELEGRLVTADETNDLIIRRLKADGRHLLTEQYVHTYPHCWRCRSKLIYYARDSWFVRTSILKDRMLEFNDRVAWHPPEVGTGRFGEWLSNNVDWALSRDRYWGTPLPVWTCDRDPAHVTVIGSYAELAERRGAPLPGDFDPHKPFIDAYTWPCACGGTMTRAPEVIDTWFDSGSMPYAQWHYPFEHEAEFGSHFPADFICEGVDQTRGWFYSLLALSTAAFDEPAYRHVIVNELVLDADGQKMSKSRGNVVNPTELLTEHGADVVRLYLLVSSQVWLPKRFDARTIPEVAGGFLNTLRNTYRFFAQYAGDWRPGGAGSAAPEALADRWILSRLAGVVDQVNDSWERYDVTGGTRALMNFVVDDLSNWYVRLNRARFWAPDREADPAALATLHRCLLVVARLLAPAAPFLPDWIHRALDGASVHLARFPEPGDPRDEALETAMDAIRRLASLARAAREAIGSGVRQPLARMVVAVPAAVRGPGFDALLDLLRQEVNVKAVEVVESDAGLVTLRAKPNFRSLGRRYGKETPAAAAAASRLDPAQLRRLEEGGSAEVEVDGRRFEYLSEDVAVTREVASSLAVQSDGPFVAALDPALTPALRQEGLAREMVNRIQRLRKDAGYDLSTRVALSIDGAQELLRAVEAHRDFIQGETLARELAVGSRADRPDREQELALDGLEAVIGIQRHDDARPAGRHPHTDGA
jgi:isoleucyl-tRNA synthetase